MSATMRALICHAFGPIADLRVETVPVPEPGPGEVRVREIGRAHV